MELRLTSTVALDQGVELRRYPQGHLVCAFGTSHAFEVDAVGALLLLNLKNPTTVASLIDHLSAVFDESPEHIQSELLDFLRNCIELKIIRVSHHTMDDSDESGANACG